ncbi:MAG: hypothetical protein V3S82_08785 [Dehalococcoidia bacterium]
MLTHSLREIEDVVVVDNEVFRRIKHRRLNSVEGVRCGVEFFLKCEGDRIN